MLKLFGHLGFALYSMCALGLRPLGCWVHISDEALIPMLQLLYTCMYACMDVCMHVCMYVCVCMLITMWRL